MTADDYFAIQNLIYRYCDRIDRGDFAGIAQLFAHAEIHVPALPAPVRGVAAIEAMYTQFTRVYPETGTPRTRHVTSNVIIEPDGRGRGARAVLRSGAPGHRRAAPAAHHRRALLRSFCARQKARGALPSGAWRWICSET